MSVSNESLQKLLQEIEAKSMLAQREINMVKTSISAKQRDIRLIELTSNELKSLPESTKIYEGVGKMFVQEPKAEVGKRLASETEDIKSDISNLNKKLNYLETTHKNSKSHIDQILRGASGK